MDVGPEVGLAGVNRNGRSDVKDYILEVNGNGAAFVDYDVDGDADLALTNGSTFERYRAGGDAMVELYRNHAGRFAVSTASARAETRGWAAGICAADYDNDGFVDLYVTGYGPNVLYRNLGDGTFAPVDGAAGVGDRRWGTNCAFGDYDRDGDVDLYVANYIDFDPAVVPRRGESEDCTYLGERVFCGPAGLPPEHDVLYRNEGDGTFVDVTAASGAGGEPHTGFGVLFSDLDDDGWPDLYVVNDAMPNQLFHNLRDGTFEEVGLFAGSAFSAEGRAQSGMGVDAQDFDGDGILDLFVTNFARDTNTLYRGQGDLFYLPATADTGAGAESFDNLGWGTGLVDLDNDGWRDLFVANGHVYPEIARLDPRARYRQPKELYRNVGEGRFVPITATAGTDLSTPWSSRGVAFADADNDGDIDVAVVNLDDRPSLYRNDTANAGHWLGVTLVGRADNRAAVGAHVTVSAGGFVQVAEVRSGGSYLSHNDLRLHFGLGAQDRVDDLVVRWPNGSVERFGAVGTDRFVTLRQGTAPTQAARNNGSP